MYHMIQHTYKSYDHLVPDEFNEFFLFTDRLNRFVQSKFL